MSDKNPKVVYLIQINYVSGTSVQGWFKKFDIDHVAGSITSYDYLCEPTLYPRALLIGKPETIESIFTIDTKVIDEPA